MIPISPVPSLALPSKSVPVVVLSDTNQTAAIIDLLLERSGLTTAEASRRLGIKPSSLQQYRNRRRKRPSVEWFSRLAAVCGARIVIEWVETHTEMQATTPATYR